MEINNFDLSNIETQIRISIHEMSLKMKNYFKDIDFDLVDKNPKNFKIIFAENTKEILEYDYKNNILYFNNSVFNIKKEVLNHLIAKETLNIASNRRSNMGIMNLENHNRGLNAGIREILVDCILNDDYKEYQTKFCNAAIIMQILGYNTITKCFFYGQFEKIFDKLMILFNDRKKLELLFTCMDISFDLEEKYKKQGINKYNFFEINIQKILSDIHSNDTMLKIKNDAFDNIEKLKTYLKNYKTCLINSKKLKNWNLNPENYNGIDENYNNALIDCNNLFEYYTNYNKPETNKTI